MSRIHYMYQSLIESAGLCFLNTGIKGWTTMSYVLYAFLNLCFFAFNEVTVSRL